MEFNSGFKGLNYSSTHSKLLKPRDYFTYHQVYHSNILHGAHIAFTCFARISQQTATLALQSISRLVMYNQGRECLLRGTHGVLI